MRRKYRRASPLYLNFFLLIICILILVCFTRLVRIYKNSSWDSNRRFTLVLSTKSKTQNNSSVIVFSIEPRQKRAIYLIFPSDTLLEVPYGYQDYIASSVYTLGELDKTKGGGKLLEKSIENTLSVAVDGYIMIHSSKEAFFPENEIDATVFMKENSSLYSFFWVWYRFIVSGNTVETNLSFIDLFQLWRKTADLRTDQVVIKDMVASSILTDLKRADASVVKQIDLDRFDLSIGDLFEDEQIRIEQTSVEIANATDQAGVASKFRKLLERLGVHVVSITTIKVPEDFNCEIQYSDKKIKKSIIVDRFTTFNNCKIQTAEQLESQADIRIIVGKQFLEQ